MFTEGKVMLWNSGGGMTVQQVLAMQLDKLKIPINQVQAHLHTLRNADAFRSVSFGSDPSSTIAFVKERCASAPVLWEDMHATVARAHIITALTRSYLINDDNTTTATDDDDKDPGSNSNGSCKSSSSMMSSSGINGEWIGRVIHSSFYMQSSDHASYPSDIDYLLVVANRSLIITPQPSLPSVTAFAIASSTETKTVPTPSSSSSSSSSDNVVPLLPTYHSSVTEAVRELFDGCRQRCDAAIARATVPPPLIVRKS
jgi:hypothetical protein